MYGLLLKLISCFDKPALSLSKGKRLVWAKALVSTCNWAIATKITKTIDIFNSYDILYAKIYISDSPPLIIQKGWELPNGQNSSFK